MTAIHKLTVVAFVTTAASLMPSLSWAGAQEQAAAESLFQDGRRLMQEGNFTEACPKLVESNKLDPAVGTLLYLGECYEKCGQTASAWATFQAAADAAHKDGQADRARIASNRASALFSKLSRLSITVTETARVPGLEVRRDGVQMGQATWGVAVPLDPGEHVIAAKAPGKKDWQQTVKIEADGATETVEIPALQDAVAIQPQPTMVGPSQPPVADTMMVQQPSSNRGKTQRTVAFVAGGVGVLGLATGMVFGLEAKSKQNQAESHCLTSDPTACNQQGVDLRHTGHTYATVANVGFVVGALGLIGGAALYFTAPRAAAPTTGAVDKKRSRQQLAIIPAVGTQSSSLLLTGSF